jgi:hypothetical protein
MQRRRLSPPDFRNFKNRPHRKLAGSAQYYGVVSEENDSVSFLLLCVTVIKIRFIYYAGLRKKWN